MTQLDQFDQLPQLLLSSLSALQVLLVQCHPNKKTIIFWINNSSYWTSYNLNGKLIEQIKRWLTKKIMACSECKISYSGFILFDSIFFFLGRTIFFYPRWVSVSLDILLVAPRVFYSLLARSTIHYYRLSRYVLFLIDYIWNIMSI